MRFPLKTEQQPVGDAKEKEEEEKRRMKSDGALLGPG